MPCVHHGAVSVVVFSTGHLSSCFRNPCASVLGSLHLDFQVDVSRLLTSMNVTFGKYTGSHFVNKLTREQKMCQNAAVEVQLGAHRQLKNAILQCASGELDSSTKACPSF